MLMRDLLLVALTLTPVHALRAPVLPLRRPASSAVTSNIATDAATWDGRRDDAAIKDERERCSSVSKF